jgi:hypothetical protein
MNRPQPFRSNAANAVVELDCPWCAEPILTTSEELEDGLQCPACQVRTALGPVETPALVPIAA